MNFEYFGFLDELIKKGLIPNVEGCSTNELLQLENSLNTKLPKAYVEFLFLAGKNSPWHNAEAGNFYNGIDYMKETIPELVHTYQELGMKDLIVDSNIIPIWFHDGFAYLKQTEGDNPPVYTFWCGPSAKHFISSDTFLGYIIKLVKETLINYSKFGGESGWSINGSIGSASNKNIIHKWRILAEKNLE